MSKGRDNRFGTCCPSGNTMTIEEELYMPQCNCCNKRVSLVNEEGVCGECENL